MIPFIIYTLIKKYSNKSWAQTRLQLRKYLSARFQFIFFSLLIIILALIPLLSKSQQLKYRIVQGGDDIGWLRLEKKITGDTSSLLLVSEIKKRIFFLITVSAKESSVYKCGKLIYSSQYRKTNGNTQVDKQTRFIADKYEVEDDGEKQNLATSFIGKNLLCLYFQEPIGINMVYSDNHQCFIKVTKTDDGGYKVKFPDGNSNCYYYGDGICTKIIVSHTFYTAEIILNL